MAGAAKEAMCFENCRAKDGRLVRLTKRRYDDHVLAEHPDLARDFAYPVSEIQKALECAERICPGAYGPTQEYIGPVVLPDNNHGFGFSAKPRRMHVIVWRETGNTAHVVTAYTALTRG